MANKKENTKTLEKAKKDLMALNNTFNDTIDNLSTNMTGTSNTNNIELDRLDKEVDRIINSELTGTKSITSDDMSTFMVKLFNDFDLSTLPFVIKTGRNARIYRRYILDL